MVENIMNEKNKNLTQIDISGVLPLFKTNIDPNSNECKLALRGIFDELEKNYNIKSNIKSKFMSSWTSHKENYKFVPLVKYVANTCNFLLRDIFSSTYEVKCLNCWGAIYEKGDYAIEHHHFPNTFGSIVYLQLEENCSNIFFNESEISISSGDILIFPGLLKHHVLPTNGKRIVVSMNFNCEY